MARRQFRFGWRITGFSVICLCVFLSLGFWQLERSVEKAALIEVMQEQADAPPAPLSRDSGTNGDRVKITGKIDDRLLLLENRILDGEVGYEVIQPVAVADGMLVLVDRGFVPASLSRTQLPVVPPAPGQVDWVGTLYVPAGAPFMLGEQAVPTTFPAVVMDARPSVVSAGFEEPLYRYMVRLDADQPGALPRDWRVTIITPEKHFGYALQWWAMALAVVLMFLWVSFPRVEENEDE